MYCYVWSYVVRPEYVEAFRTAYGPEGEWVQLFRRDRGYIRTDLLADRDNPEHFMTIDFWSSREPASQIAVPVSPGRPGPKLLRRSTRPT